MEDELWLKLFGMATLYARERGAGDEAEDVAQEALLMAWRWSRRYRGVVGPRYVRQGVRWSMGMRARRARRRVEQVGLEQADE